MLVGMKTGTITVEFSVQLIHKIEILLPCVTGIPLFGAHLKKFVTTEYLLLYVS